MLYRFLTLQEANTFLPLVKERFSQIHSLVAEGQLLHETLPAAPGVESSPEGGQTVSTVLNDERAHNLLRIREIEQLIKEEVISLNQIGAIVKSVFPPRVDFLSKRHQQPAYLCWQMGEKKITHWRPLDEDFLNRRTIQKPEAFGPFVVH